MNLYYIYSIANPIDNNIFYIGQTMNPEKRFKEHCCYRKITAKENKQKIKIINLIIECGKQPIFNIIECVIGNKIDAEIAETKHIDYYKYKGLKLVNLTTVYNRSSDNGKKLKIISIKDNIINNYKGIRECSSQLKIPHSNIIEVLKGKRKTAGGYQFKYI